ncbi:MAG: tetratricopeptide repeat protein [Opitutales bacterium]
MRPSPETGVRSVKPTAEQAPAHPPWVLVTGAIRDLVDCCLTLEWLVLQRGKGRLGPIVLSTWQGAVDAHDGLRVWLKRNRVRLVESPEPPVSGPSNAYRQWAAFTAGMRPIPDDVRVLKARTDKCLKLLPVFLTALEKPETGTRKPGGLEGPFRYPLTVEFAMVSYPGGFNDMAFLGWSDDLRQMTGIFAEPAATWRNPDLNPCYSWLPLVLGKRFPHLARMPEIVDTLALSDSLIRWASDDAPSAPAAPPDCVLAWLAAGSHLVPFLRPVRSDAGDSQPAHRRDLRAWLGRKAGRDAAGGLTCLREANHQKSIAWTTGVWTAWGEGSPGSSAADQAFMRACQHLRETGGRAFSFEKKDHQSLMRFLRRYASERIVLARPPVRDAKVWAENKPRRKPVSAPFNLIFGDLAYRPGPDEEAVLRQLLREETGRGMKTERVYVSIGDAYAKGEALPASMAVARIWWEKAARQKSGLAHLRLGNGWLKGRFGKTDFSRARQHLEQAWKRRVVEAGYPLGRLLVSGRGGARDPEKGHALWRQAAQTGCLRSQEALKARNADQGP